jgi:hypothetical protein
VKASLYSRWDGTQQAFSLDAKQALALSRDDGGPLAREALMTASGFIAA